LLFTGRHNINSGLHLLCAVLEKAHQKNEDDKGVLSEGTAAMDGNQAVVFQWISKIVSNHKVVEQIAESASTDPVFQSIKSFLNNYSKGAH